MTRLLVAALLVALWLGAALLAVVVVAPAAFAVLPTRALAGDMVGRVLPVVFGGAMAVPALVHLLAPVLRRSALAVGAGAVAVLSAAVALWIVDPRIAAIRAAAVVPVDQLTPGDPRRALFGVLHAVSVALLGLAMVSTAAMLIPIARAVRGHVATRPAP